MLVREHNVGGFEVRGGALPNPSLIRFQLVSPWDEDTNRHREFTVSAAEADELLHGSDVVLGPGLVKIALSRQFGGPTSNIERTCLVVTEAGQRFTYVFDEFLWSHFRGELTNAIAESKRLAESVTVRVTMEVMPPVKVFVDHDLDPGRSP